MYSPTYLFLLEIVHGPDTRVRYVETASMKMFAGWLTVYKLDSIV